MTNQTQREDIAQKLTEAQRLLEMAKQNAAHADDEHAVALTDHFLGRLSQKDFKKREQEFRAAKDSVHDAELLVMGMQREHDEIQKEHAHEQAKRNADTLRKVNRRHNEAAQRLLRHLSEVVFDYQKLLDLQQEATQAGWKPNALHHRAMTGSLALLLRHQFNRWITGDQWAAHLIDGLARSGNNFDGLTKDLFMTPAVRKLLDDKPSLQEISDATDRPVHAADGQRELPVVESGGDDADAGGLADESARDLIGNTGGPPPGRVADSTE